MWKNTLLFALAILVLASPATAQTIKVTIFLADDGMSVDGVEIGDRWTNDSPEPRLKIVLATEAGDLGTAGREMRLFMADSDADLENNATFIGAIAEERSSGTFSVDAAGKRLRASMGDVDFDLAGRIPARSTMPVDRGPAPLDVNSHVPTGDSAAWKRPYYNWFREEGIRGHLVEARGLAGLKGRRYTLYHLPDGSPAFPIPEHISEKDRVVLCTLIPAGAVVEFEILGCGEVPPLRVQGDFAEIQSLLAGEVHSDQSLFELAYHSADGVRCADNLVYRIQTTMAGAAMSGRDAVFAPYTGTIPMDPVYRFTWSAGYGFDFGQRPEYSLGNRSDGDGGSESVVVEDDNRHGDVPLLVLQLHPFGSNPHDWGWVDFLLSPFFALDPDRLGDGFAFGNAFTPLPGFSILVGVGIFEEQELPEILEIAAGDVWTAPGELPTRNVYGEQSDGLILGVSFSTEVFKALSGR